MKKKYHKSSLWTKADDFIEEVAQWMNDNIGSNSKITVNIKVKNKKGSSVYAVERRF